MKKSLFTIGLLMTTMLAGAQNLLDSLRYRVEMQATTSSGTTPLWLNANKYGLSSLERNNGYLRASIERPLYIDNEKKWGLGYGLDVAGAYGFTSKAIVQQAFVEGRWLKGTLTIGSKQYPMELKNQELSTGAQTLGINARPVPQVRIALPEYWALPFTNGWVSIKGHIAYGKTTDDEWQKDFTHKQQKYTENTLYHTKAGYLKIGNEYRFKPISLELGLELGSQFAGDAYKWENGQMIKIENKKGLGAMKDAFFMGGEDVKQTTYQNAGGNHLGSWLMRLNFDYDAWYLGVYADHFFEDHSAMFMLEYDGYGEGTEWNSKKKRRYLVYELKDIQLGLDLRLKNATWINNILIEYVSTKYQSGPIYHDRTQSFSDHIGGMDDYYNHYIYTGWQHWGQVMGNPLYLSPIYNNDGKIAVKDNRFTAYHLGLAGDPNYNLHYRVLATYQKGYGTYVQPETSPYTDPLKTWSLLFEAKYRFPYGSKMAGWSIKGAYGMDLGKLLGHNYGGQLTIAKTGMLKIRKK